MNMSGTRRGMGMGVGIGAALTVAMASLAPAQPPSGDKDKPALNPPGSDKQGLADRPGIDRNTSTKVDIWTEARPVLEQELEVVKALKSLKGEATTLWEHDVEGQQQVRQEFKTSYALQKPDKLFIDSRDVMAWVDGRTVTVYAKSLHQYMQRPMPQLWLLRDTLEQMSNGQIRTIPGEPMLRPGMALEQTLRGVNSVERIRTGEFDGKVGTWVSGSATDDRQPGSGQYGFDRWYSDTDHLVYCIRNDMTGMYQDMAERIAAEESEGSATPKKAQRYLQVKQTTRYKRDLNPKLDPDTFSFRPAPGDRKVDQFVWLIHSGVKDQMAMLGKPAPAIAGKDFGSRDAGGKELPPRDIELSAYKGKVVVLDFWATWCGPCCAALPSMQMIKDKYADKPFVMLGMNREHPGDERKVRPFLERRKLDIPQFNDIDGKGAEAFFTTSTIPCVVIIDPHGNVADIETGYLPGKEKELIAKLDKLFAGQPVHTTEEIQAINEQVAAAAEVQAEMMRSRSKTP